MASGVILMSDPMTCRYCPFYAADFATPIKGHCAFFLPPKRIFLPFDGCPLGNSAARIDNAALSKQFCGQDLKRVIFRTFSPGGIPSRYYQSLDDLRQDFPRPDKVLACYVNRDDHIFYRAIVPEAAATLGDDP